MKKYVVHVSNPTSLDERVSVMAGENDLAEVAYQAVARIVEAEGSFDLPMFIDIHPAETAPEFEPLPAHVAM